MMNTLTMDRAASKAKPAHLSPKTPARSLAFVGFAGASTPLAAIAFVGFLLTLVAFSAPASAQQTPSPTAGEIVLTLPDGGLTIDEGDSKDIMVELSAQPSTAVTVALAKTNTDITLSKDSLDFTDMNWDTAQSVTVTAGQDADATDDEDTLTLSATGGITASNIVESIDIIDDDGSIVFSAAAVELIEGSEDDRSKTFTVELGAPPASKAVLSLSSGDPAAVTVSPARLNFLASDYDKAQQVTVTAVNDGDFADEMVDITVSVVSGITAEDASKSIEVSDDDAIVVSPSNALKIWEGDDARSLAISLARVPTEDVTLTLSKTNAKVTITPATLTFTKDNHFKAQIVEISATYDDDAITNTDTITLSATGGIDAPDEIALTINEPRSRPVSEIVLTLPAAELTIAEGGTEDITVKLGAQPSSLVDIELTKTNPDITLSRSFLTFNTSNWETAQSVTVSAGQDDDATDDEGSLTLSVQSGGIVALQVVESIAITDDDDGSITVSAAAVNLVEGSEDDRRKTFTVKLGTPPASSAVLSVMSGDTAVATVSPATLTFSASDYDQEQMVTVTAVDDGDSADETVDITVSVSSGITAGKVKKSVSVRDDDGRILIDLDPLSIEEGNNENFAVRLSGAPASNAVLSVTSADTSVATVSPATLTFTATNYDDEKLVNVSAVGDSDGTDDSVEIVLSVMSGYTDVDDVKKSVMVVDDDGGIVVSSTSVSLEEIDPPANPDDPYTPDTGTFTVELAAPPASKAVVSVTSPDPSAVTVSPTTLTFSASNHDDPQEVTITALSDKDGTSEDVAIVLSIAEEGYTAKDETKAIAVRDDDAGIVFDKTTMSLREGGAGDRFLVSLKSPPSSSATFKVGSQGQGKDAVRVTPEILTFTYDNYKDAQAVTVSAVEDSDTSNENLTVEVSSDQGYAGASETITVEVIDDDGIVLNVPSLTLNEGDKDVPFYVSLSGIPDSGNAVISLSSADTSAVTVKQATLTFTSTNYATGQIVEVSAVEDDMDASDHEVHITLTVLAGYTAPPRTMRVHVIDNEGGIILEDSSLMTIAEGDTTGGTFNVKLKDRVSSDAVLSLTIDDPEGRCASAVAGITDETACPITVSPDELTFTSVNYGTAQPVTVTSRYDNDDQDEEDIVITIAATEGMTAEAVTKEIKVEEPEVDPDKQINNLPDGAIVVSPSGAINLDEGGIGADIEVSIDTQPTSTVTVSILSSDSHVAVFPTSLTFDAYGWNKDTDKQKVTLSTRQDANDVDDEVTITFVATGGIDAMPFEKKVNVKDTVSGSELIVYPNGALHIGEGGTGVLSVKLGSQPAADTTVSLSNANDDITLHEVDDERFQSTLSSLAFTPSNWNDPQTFIVRAKADADAENDRDTIVIAADGFSDRRIDVLVTDGNDDLPVRAYALAIPPDSAQDNSTVRVHCKEDTPCQVMLDCNAQNDGSSFEGWIPRILPAHGGMTLSTTDIKRYTGASWSGKGRLGCALRSEQRISAQVWTRSGDGVLVNNSAALRSVPEGSGYRVDIESISSPDTPEESNLRIRCLAPDAQDCVEMRLSCYSDDGTMHHDGSITVDRLAVRHLQSEELAGMIGHRWLEMGLACEIYSDHPFTVQVLTRTGGGGALVNNSAIGRRDR